MPTLDSGKGTVLTSLVLLGNQRQKQLENDPKEMSSEPALKLLAQ